jgi:MFS family permease
MKKRSLKVLIQDNRLQLIAAFGLLLTAALLTIRLGSMPAHFSSNELATYQTNMHLHNILHNPLNAPYNLVDYAFLYIPGHTIAVARLTSALFAVIAALLFFMIMLRWHGKRTAWMASALFTTSGWLLHLGRLGTPVILWLLIPLILILFGSWLSRTDRHGTAIIVVGALLGLMLFVPAAVWFVIAFTLLLSKDILRHFREADNWQGAAAISLVAVFAAAIAFSLVRSPDLVRPWLGVPQVLPSYMSMLKVWVSSLFLYPFFRGPFTSEIWLGHTPILDMFTTVMFLLGAYFYATHFRNIRARILAVIFLLGSVLTALNGPAGMSFIVPLLYLIAATGITYLLHQWLTVFPKNPVARVFGITLITLAIAIAATYHVIAYYVAWQHNPKTVATFQRKP